MDTETSSRVDGRRSVRQRIRDLGERRVASSVVFGSVSLLIGAGCMLLGAWIAVTAADPASAVGPPEALFANAIVLLGALLVAALGGIVGFLSGVVGLTPVLLSVLGWRRMIVTAAITAAIEIVAITLVVVVAAWAEDSAATELTIPVALVVLGGLVPGAARWLATAQTSEP